MEFFANITTAQIAGLILLAGGAVLSFAAKWIAGRLRHRHADIAVKIAGLCVVIAGFVMIFI